jgi:hypothetical protein
MADEAPKPDDIEKLIVIDLGKHRKGRIKKLREGRGALMDEVKQTLDELRASGTIAGNVQPVVLVVKEKPDDTLFMRGLLR